MDRFRREKETGTLLRAVQCLPDSRENVLSGILFFSFSLSYEKRATRAITWNDASWVSKMELRGWVKG